MAQQRNNIQTAIYGYSKTHGHMLFHIQDYLGRPVGTKKPIVLGHNSDVPTKGSLVMVQKAKFGKYYVLTTILTRRPFEKLNFKKVTK